MGVLNFRKYARVEVDIPIKFFAKGSEDPLSAYLNNLSEEGASLVCPFSIPAATLLEFDVKLPKISEALQFAGCDRQRRLSPSEARRPATVSRWPRPRSPNPIRSAAGGRSWI